MIKTFYLIRREDVSGNTSAGTVAEGVQFSNGYVALRWLVIPSSVCLFESIRDVEALHGHNGKTRVEWIEEEFNDE